MTDQPDTPSNELAENLEKLTGDVDNLESVIGVLFETLASQGLKATPHIGQSLARIRHRLSVMRSGCQQAARQLEQLQQLVRTSALITSSLNLNQVLEEVMDTVIQLTGAERAYLMLYDADNQLQVRSARNWDKETLNSEEARFSRGIIDAAIQDEKPIITTNAQADERFGTRESIVIQQLRSILCIPLTMRGQTVGVLYADNRFRQGIFQEESIPILTAFGTQAAIAIQNAKAFGAVRDDLAEAQREIYRLRIQIDQSKVDRHVTQITETAYFRDLSEKAKAFRKEHEGKRKKSSKREEK